MREEELTRSSRSVEIPPHLARLIPLIAVGYTNAEIANDLGLSKHTVENYVGTLVELAGVPNAFN